MYKPLTWSFIAALLALSCNTSPQQATPAEGGTAVAPVQQFVQGPLSGLAIRTDGYYRTQSGDVIRLMRFFPDGNVVLINGTTDIEADLPKFLIRETKGDPSLGLHNVPAVAKGDSVFFTIHPEKGELDFRGKVMSGSMLNFMRISHINGRREQLEYIFYPDASAS
jgi:hypothetical protein